MEPLFSRIINLPEDHSFFLFGPRQVGKSTLIQGKFPPERALWYNLLLQSDFRRLQENPDLIIEDIKNRDPKKTHVVIDEVQKLPAILDLVHYSIENLDNPPFFILTGSSARKLKRGQANLLGGRLFSYNLAPLTYLELKDDKNFSLKKVLEQGTLPAIYSEKNNDYVRKALENYVDTYLKEEIKEEALIRNLASFVEFLRFAAEENGNVMNYTKISNETGVSSTTIKEYFQILEDTLLGFFLKPFSRTIRKRVAKKPKFYFFDTGLKRALSRELSLELQMKTKDFGFAFEHFIIREFSHLINYLDRDLEISYYRTESGAEVDLIVSTAQKETYAIEIKATNRPRKAELKGLQSFKSAYPEAKLYCVCLSPNRYKEGDVEIYPWQEIFDLFFDKNYL